MAVFVYCGAYFSQSSGAGRMVRRVGLGVGLGGCGAECGVVVGGVGGRVHVSPTLLTAFVGLDWWLGTTEIANHQQLKSKLV